MKWLSLVAVGCSAPAPHAVEPVVAACVPIGAPHGTALAGRVTDPTGRGLAGVVVAEADWSEMRGEWSRETRNKITTGADGSYELSLVRAPDAVVTFELDHRQVVWARLDAPRRIDVELDLARPAGVIAIHDGRIESGDPCAAWTCPVDRAPGDGWWLQRRPCPDGGELRYLFDPAGAVVTIRCERAGQPHGPSTTWSLRGDHAWDEHAGFHDHGRRCGTWREPPESPPLVEHPPAAQP